MHAYTVACLAWVLSFAFLGAYTGMALMVLSGLNIWGSYKLSKWSRNKQLSILLLLLVLAFSLTILTWHGWPSMFALAGWSLMTLSVWSKQTQDMRRFGVAMAASWLVYSTAVFSIFSMISDAITLVSNVIALAHNRESVSRRHLSRTIVHTRKKS